MHPNVLTGWKKQLLDELPTLFADKRVRADKEKEALTDQLYQQIGQLKVELDGLKKKWDTSAESLEEGHAVNKKRVQRLMGVIGLRAMTPGLHTSRPNPDHAVYPYRPRGVKIERVDQVWSCDIAYLPLTHGYLYRFAVLDWYSRFVLSWRLSNTLDVAFCLDGLEEALSRGKPGIFNTDQGSQFTSREFTSRLLSAEVTISRDGRGRALDNYQEGRRTQELGPAIHFIPGKKLS